MGMVCGRCSKSVWSWRKIVESSAEFYVDSRACVRVGNDMSEWFSVNVGFPFCFLLIKFHCTFSISYKIQQYFVYYYYYILIRM